MTPHDSRYYTISMFFIYLEIFSALFLVGILIMDIVRSGWGMNIKALIALALIIVSLTPAINSALRKKFYI